jgi:hypothetical protein
MFRLRQSFYKWFKTEHIFDNRYNGYVPAIAMCAGIVATRRAWR